MGLAAIRYNDGMKVIPNVLTNLGISCGSFSRRFCETADFQRIKLADLRATEASLEYRRRKRQERLATDEAAEDGAYSCGNH